MPKVLFVMRDDGYMTEPMSIMTLSALGKRIGWTSDLALLDRDNIVDVVRKRKPDVVAFSVMTGSHQAFLTANAQIKAAMPSVKTVIGGPYATFRPTVIREHEFDALGVGECDDAWPEMLQAMEAGRSLDDIPNIITPGNANRVLRRTLFGKKTVVVASEHLRPRNTRLDDLPFMDREIVYANTAFIHRPKRTMMAGRGCPFRCTYCFEHAWNEMYEGKGKVFQKMSVPRLVEELKALKRDWDTRYIKWYDDVFPVQDEAWLAEFAEAYNREIGLPFHCLIRAEMATPMRLKLLKNAGIHSLSMSIEGGNTFVRDYVLIRDMDDEDMTRAFAMCRELRIPTMTNAILAVPAPTLPDVHADETVYAEQLEKVMRVAAEVDPKRRKMTAKLQHIVDAAVASSSTEMEKRLAVDAVLREAGVRATRIEYDIESVVTCARNQVSFVEFPVFFPYEGTQLGEYVQRHGYFNGDFDSLPASYQTESPLDCYTPEEKLIQQNLALLGTILNLFAGSYYPWMNALTKPMQALFLEKLVHLPWTTLYVRLYSIAKNHMQARRIYRLPFSLRERFRDFWTNFKLDYVKQMSKADQVLKPAGFRGDRPGGQTLGGPPST